MSKASHKALPLLGCILGLAVGDVLGCPVEGLSFREIQERYGTVDRLLSPPPGRYWRLPGLHSDDTQQALAVMEAFRLSRRPAASENGIPQGSSLAWELASIYVAGVEVEIPHSFGCWRGTGQNFRHVVNRLRQNRRGPQWPYGYGAPSAGLGAVMRIAPLGLLESTPAGVVDAVSHATAITHTDPRAILSACTVALACHLLARETPQALDPDAFLSRLHRLVGRLEQRPPRPAEGTPEEDTPPLHAELIALVAELSQSPPGTAMRQIAERTHALTGQKPHPTGGFAPAGVAASLYFFLHDARSPTKALFTAINAGGDTDTIGAIVGALCGTMHGPAAYREFLPDLVALDLIGEIARACLDPQVSPSLDLVEEEGFLTRIEQALRWGQ